MSHTKAAKALLARAAGEHDRQEYGSALVLATMAGVHATLALDLSVQIVASGERDKPIPMGFHVYDDQG